jgi:hypothetical protein
MRRFDEMSVGEKVTARNFSDEKLKINIYKLVENMHHFVDEILIIFMYAYIIDDLENIPGYRLLKIEKDNLQKNMTN